MLSEATFCTPNRMLLLLRVSADLTQAEAASRSGVHRITISRLEAGKTRPQRRVACRIAAALGVDPAVIWPDVFPELLER
jgi:transcriptional regulator with XRE-family HTH domain